MQIQFSLQAVIDNTHAHMHIGFFLDRSSNTLHLSPIFLWFAGDFEAYGGVVKFVSSYISESDAAYIMENSPSLSYFSYDWNVNGKPPCSC